MTIDEIVKSIGQYRTRHVTVTGGEPLAQKPCIELLTRLCDEGFEVSLETSGAISVEAVDERVMKIMDIKTLLLLKKIKTNWTICSICLRRIKSNLLYVIVRIMTGLKDLLTNINLPKYVKCYYRRNMKQSAQPILLIGYCKTN